MRHAEKCFKRDIDIGHVLLVMLSETSPALVPVRVVSRTGDVMEVRDDREGTSPLWFLFRVLP